MAGNGTVEKDDQWVLVDAIAKVMKATDPKDFETALKIFQELAKELDTTQEFKEFSKILNSITGILRNGYELAKWFVAKDSLDKIIENLQRTDEDEGWETDDRSRDEW